MNEEIVEGDYLLDLCNETELLQIAFRQGLGVIRRGLDRQTLIAIVKGEILPQKEFTSETAWTREKLEEYIAINMSRFMSQLPGCDGKCRTFSCTELRHSQCFGSGSTTVLL